jgi:hypothetical protein
MISVSAPPLFSTPIGQNDAVHRPSAMICGLFFRHRRSSVRLLDNNDAAPDYIMLRTVKRGEKWKQAFS